MSDRQQDKPKYSVDEILSEFSSSRSGGRVVPFPTPPAPEEDPGVEEEEEAVPAPNRLKKKAEIIPHPSGGVLFVLREKVKALFRRADEYADQMYTQVEPTYEERRAEALIPGVDEEEVPEAAPDEDRPRPFRFASPPPPRDVSPSDLAAQYRAALPAAALRLTATLLMALAALWIAAGLPLPAVSGVDPYALRLVCSVAALLAAALLCADVIWSGLRALFTFRPGADTLCALAVLATLGDGLTMPSLGLRDNTLPCAAPACFLLLSSLLGKELKRRADLLSCKIASQAKEPWLVTLDDNQWSGRPAYGKWSGPIHGFGSQIQSPVCTDRVYAVAAPLLLVGCIACALLASVGREMDGQVLWALSSTLTAAAGLAAPLAYALPYRRLSLRLSKCSAALAGWPGAERCGGESFILTDGDLFPTGTAKLNGIKIYDPFPNEQVVAYAGTLIRASGCGLQRTFSDLMKSQNALYRPCMGLDFFEGGITGVIHGQEVLVGTAAFLRLMNVRLPQGLAVKSALFCAIDGQLAGIFAIHYTLHGDVAPCLAALLRGGHSPLLATRDPNLLPSLLENRFKLPVDRMEFPAVERRRELSDPDRPHTAPLTAVLLREGLLPYSDAALGACRLRTAARLGAGLSVLGGVVGLVLTFYLTFADAYHSLSPLALLAFLAAWLIPPLVLGDWVTRY